ncbi:MAG: hypothetical protein GX442_13490 [Candidatus Riflebacteria bacterium]|nr:hypothetical protein [Candidatus Riflebacteria bacterium]
MSEQERKIRMATAESPREQGHTIVGGRPAGVRTTGSAIPRGMEAMMMKAAVDAAFLGQLLERRSALADELGIALDPAERFMLDRVPAGQLREMARRTPVTEAQRGVLHGGPAAAALLALVTQLTFAPVAGRAETPADGTTLAQGQPNDGVSAPVHDTWAGGARPDEPLIMPPGGARPDLPERPVSRGIQPDIPDDDRMTKGIRPHLPPHLEPPRPDAQPVATSPLTMATMRDLVVRTNSAGLSFEQAIAALQDETGIGISVPAAPGLDFRKVMNRSVSGMPLGKAIRALCGEVAGEGAHFQIDMGDSSLVIRFKALDGGSSVPSPAPAPQISPDGGSGGYDATRGIRPDVPRPRGD